MADQDMKDVAAGILSKRKVGGADSSYRPDVPAQPKDEDEMIDGRHLAAQNMLSAIESKSARQMSEAMSDWMSIHNSKTDDESAEQSE